MLKRLVQSAAFIACAAFTLPSLAPPAVAESVAMLRIEAALAAIGQAPGINATSGDILSLERDDSQGPSLAVTLHPSFDQAMADLTDDRAGQRLIISVCGRIVLEPLLNEPLPNASILITADDPAFLDEVEAALRAQTCDVQLLG
jgi:hypothetical protein